MIVKMILNYWEVILIDGLKIPYLNMQQLILVIE